MKQRGVGLAGDAQSVEHVGAQVGHQLGIAGEILLQPRRAFADGLVLHLDAGGLGLRQPGHHVGGHEGMALIGFPPAPAAVFVLEAVETVEPGADLLLERGLVQVGLQTQIARPPGAR